MNFLAILKESSKYWRRLKLCEISAFGTNLNFEKWMTLRRMPESNKRLFMLPN